MQDLTAECTINDSPIVQFDVGIRENEAVGAPADGTDCAKRQLNSDAHPR